MFAKSIKASPYGELFSRGQSKVWETNIDIPYLGNDFSVRITGTKDGPTLSQCNAFEALINCAFDIKRNSTSKILDYIVSNALIAEESKVSPDNLWNIISPELIEVHSDNSYCLGAGTPGTNAISVGYRTPWDEEHSLQLGILSGAFDSVYAE